MRALVGTVGNRDLELDGETAHARQQTMREFGQELLDRFDEVQERLRAPMLERALTYLADIGELPDQLVLIVTDQPEERAYRAGDTVLAGDVISRLLRRRYGIQGRTSIKRLTCVPALIDPVMDQFELWFPQWSRQYNRIYVITTGGTPAMSTAMVLVALECCPDQVTPLYAPLGEEVRPTNVLQRTKANQQRRELIVALDHGRFGQAVIVLGDRGEHLAISDYAHRVLSALVRSADARLRFDLDAARSCLIIARREPRLDDQLHSGVAVLQRSLPRNDDTAGLLAELYHNARQKLRHGEYADFVLRLFNFQQAALRYACERMGVPFHRSGEYVRVEWLASQPGFTAAAAAFPNPDGGTGLDLGDGKATGPFLLCLVEYLAGKGELPENVAAVARRLQSAAALRNRCFAAHDFRGVGRADLESAIGARHENEVADLMSQLYRASTGRDLGPDPFELTARIAADLLEQNRSR